MHLALASIGLFAVTAVSPVVAAIHSETPPYPSLGEIERLDPALDELLAPDARLEKLAEGFNWSEGPVWRQSSNELWFSDVPENVAYRWREGHGVEVALKPSGLTAGAYDGREPGSNGLTVDHLERLVLAQHGDRRVARLAEDGQTFTTLADRYEGGRFNSPNDLCFDRAGNLYFTDPPYGLGRTASRDLDFQGVYRLAPDGQVSLLTREMTRPNGIALSPDEKMLYVANSDGSRPVIVAYPLRGDGTLEEGRVLFDGSALMKRGRRGLPDGLKVDTRGNLWATGPGGVLILSSDGRHLGTLLIGQATANCAFGGDGSVLYITADAILCRIQTRVRGANLP